MDDRKSLLMAFLAISDQYVNYYYFFLTKWAAILDHRKSLSITFLFQINTQLFWGIFFQNGRRWPFWKSHLGHFGSPKITFDRISRHFRSIRNLNLFGFSRWPPAAILEVPICTKNYRVLPLCVINGYAQYEFIGEFMTKLEQAQAFWAFYTKWPPEAVLFFQLMPKIIGFL